jgi:hypothetical protein
MIDKHNLFKQFKKISCSKKHYFYRYFKIHLEYSLRIKTDTFGEYLFSDRQNHIKF